MRGSVVKPICKGHRLLGWCGLAGPRGWAKGRGHGQGRGHAARNQRPWLPSPGYLVVDHHVHSAVGGVGRQVAQVEGLVHDALASKRGIPVQQDGHDLQTRKTTEPVWHTGGQATSSFSHKIF